MQRPALLRPSGWALTHRACTTSMCPSLWCAEQLTPTPTAALVESMDQRHGGRSALDVQEKLG
eukprot:860167-Rhodomonas_salina.1